MTGIISPDINHYVFSWQSILLIVGILLLVKRSYTGGFVLIVIWLYFTFPRIWVGLGYELPFERRDMWRFLIAGVFFCAGLYTIIITGMGRRKEKQYLDIKTGKSGIREISCAFGEANHTIIEKPYSGMKASCAFGTLTLNLEKTRLPEGESFLEINNAFGETHLYVPENMAIVNTIHSFLGEIKDKRCNHSCNSAERLLLRGGNCFGEIKIFGIPTPVIEAEEMTEEERIDSISVKQNNRVIVLSLDDVLYIRSDGDYVTIHTSQGNYLKEQTMKYFQNALPCDRFVRIHRSFIVNLAEVASIDTRGKETYCVILKNGSSLKVSTSGYQELKQRLDL